MPLKQLIGPIAAATIVTAFWFAAMWRGHQHERHGGKLPWPYGVAFFGYLVMAGVILYALRDGALTTGLSLFAAALVSEGLGVAVTALIVQTFIIGRGQPWSERVFPIIGTVFLTVVVVGAMLTA